VVLAASAFLWATAAGATPTASDVLDRVRQLADTTHKWSDRMQRFGLRIIDRRGGERQRRMVIWVRKYPEDRLRTLVFFEAPADVRGVGLLQWADSHGVDRQWLYLPELKRVRQISGAARSESFAGTDFSYEDLTILSQLVEWRDQDARSELLRTEGAGSEECYVIEFTPVTKELTYGKVTAWFRAEDLTVTRYAMYDRAGRLVKELWQSDFRRVGAIPTAFHLEVRNAQTSGRTIVDMSEVQYDTGLDDDLFSQRALERGP
jgi:outer membrane lipoprotein-sorting protein